jgi:N-methylhydantoinase B
VAQTLSIGSEPRAGTDPVTLEVAHNALLMAAREMKAVVLRTAYSALWKEAGDLSCGLLTTKGEIVAQGPGDIPVHLACMPMSLQGCLERIPLESIKPGDVLWQNDPYQGNNHLPDLFMAAPAFVDGILVGFAAVRGHYVDVGGVGAGSYSGLTRDIHGEGFRLPAVRIYEEGEINRDVLDIFLANVRGPSERMGDFRAQHAGCIRGRAALERLAGIYGADGLMQLMEDVLDHSEALTRAQVSTIPNGTYTFHDHCDVQGAPIKIAVSIEIRDSTAIVDFTGTDPEGQHGMNCPLAVTTSATCYGIKCLSDPEHPANSGSYRAVEVIAPEGSAVNCRYPRSVVLGNHETAARILDVVVGALSTAVPDRVTAAGCGTAGPLVLAGADRRRPGDAEHFLWIEPGGGGQGASYRGDGTAGVRTGVGNSSNTPTESIEIHYPVEVLEYSLAPDTGGAGQFRGACGLKRAFRVRAEQPSLTVSFEREHFAPYGLDGGGPGTLAAFSLERDGIVETLPSKTLPLDIESGDVFTACCAGSGGYGNPFERDPARVLRDVEDGYVSVDAASAVYGVAIAGETPRLRVDESATAALRAPAGREA